MKKTEPEDLDETPASVGGAMSQWPRRTVAWACRDARAEGYDPAVIDALLATEVTDLRELERLAENVGIDPSNLQGKREALEDTGAERLREALAEEYRIKWAGQLGDDGCPFEQSGLDKACWRCPVPGRTLDRLQGDRETPPPPEVDQ